MSARRQGIVYLVDDEDALRRATARLLELHGFTVRGFASAGEFLAAFEPEAPGCLLLDLHMPGRSGLELQDELARNGAVLPIVFLTGAADVPSTVQAMKHGAIDFLEKPADEDELVAALEQGLEHCLAERRERDVLAGLRGRFAGLTERERAVMQEVITGRLNKQVALALGIAERTVKLHRARVLEKMGADSLADLVRMGERLALGPAEDDATG